MNFLKLFMLNFCPINVFRLNLEHRLPHIFKYSMIDVFNDVLEKDMDLYNKRFREIYSIPDDDDVYIFNYYRFEYYFKKNLKDKELSYSALRKLNKYGCVYKTKVPIYRALGLFVGDGVLEHYYLYHTMMIIFVTNFSCLLSSVQVFKNKYLQLFFNTAVIIAPQLMVMYLLDGLYLALAIMIIFTAFLVRYLYKKPWKKTEENPSNNGYIFYVTFARGSLIVSIIIAILAVDNIYFNQFMRKTHYDGFSAMDIGAGFFVTQTGASVALSRRKKNVWVIVKKNIIILTIAFIRLISIIVLKYGVDEREYGKHWNFFFTLGITRMVVDLINTYVNKYVVWAIPFVITISYEILLLLTRAIDKLPELPRSNIIYANKEGLMSIPNSVSGSLFVLLITKIALHYYKQGKKFYTFIVYAFISLSSFLVANVLYFTGLKSSRAMYNLRYHLYVMFLYNLALGSVVIFEMIYPRYTENKILDACGRYPLMVYLIANVLTGFVNMCFKPYLLPLTYFMIIMVVYSYIPLLCGLFFSKMNFKSMSQWL